MFKLKTGYLMSDRQPVEFERLDALPRKACGEAAYYGKPQAKYPPRIYVFMHAELWCDRNCRPMGLYNGFPFLTRPMNREEIEYRHFDARLCHHQYESWAKLLCAEQQQAQELAKEKPGAGTAFLKHLKTFKCNFPRTAAEGSLPPGPPVNAEDSETEYPRELIAIGDTLDAPDVGRLLEEEGKGKKGPAVLSHSPKWLTAKT